MVPVQRQGMVPVQGRIEWTGRMHSILSRNRSCQERLLMRTSPRMDWFQLYCAHTSTFTEFSWGFPIEPPMPAGTPGTEFRHGRRWWREIIQFPSGFAWCVNPSIIYLSRSIICFLNLCPAVQPELLVAYVHRCELGLTAWWNRLNKTLAGFNCWTSA